MTPAAPVRWGLLSTAAINEKMIRGIRAAGEAEGGVLAAVASRNMAQAEAYAAAHGIPRAHGSYEALLADDEIDVVYISTPNALHLPWVTEALRAGRHVLCEKPMGQGAAEVDAAFDLAQELGLVLAEAFMYRHHPQTAALVELVEAGTIGRLRLIRSAFSFHQADPSDPRLSVELGGGGLMDVGCYCVSAIRLLAGEPESVAATQVTGGDGVDVVMAGLLRMPGDRVGHFDCGLALADRSGLEVVGETGSLLVADPFHCFAPGIVVRRDGEADRTVAVAPADHYARQAADVVTAVRAGRPPRVGRTDAVAQARVIEALYGAARSGDWVAVPAA